MVSVLVGLGPGEERLEDAEEAVDERLRDAVVRDDHEAVVCVGLAEFVHELVAVRGAQAEGRDPLRHGRILHARTGRGETTQSGGS